jgi:hypothetical protein
MCVDAGEVSFFNHNVVSICNSFVHPKHLRGTPWTSGHLYLSSFATSITSSMTNHQVWITSPLHLGRNDRVCQIQLRYLTSSQLEYVTRCQDDVENNTLWLNLLCSFVAVKNLYLSEEYMPHITPALQELVGGRTTEVLPTLENIFLEGLQPLGLVLRRPGSQS